MAAGDEYSEAQRARWAKDGTALPDGSYPCPDCASVGRRIHEYGFAPDSHREKLAALIRRRNEELHCHHDLSELEVG